MAASRILMTKPTPEPPPPGKPRLGEVRHDDRGQAVWHWAVDTARNAINSTSQLLRKLDLSGLSLEDEQPSGAAPSEQEPAAKPQPLELAPSDAGKGARKPGAAGEFNPYKSARPVAPAKPVRPGQRLKAEEPARPSRKPRRPELLAPRPSWWRRLLGRD
jgi:hypothetical protein